MTEPLIRFEREDALAIITINRPEKLNALTFEMIEAIERIARGVDADAKVRVAIITGAGHKSFCAGGDIEAWSEQHPEDFALSWVRAGHKAFDALTRVRQPLIAALNGHTLGGGLEVAACADFRVGETQIKIGLPETSIGIIPGWSGTQRLVRRFGSQTVRRMALLGDVFTAQDALQHGVIDRISETGGSLAEARAVAAHIISQRGDLATKLTKLLINASEGEDREAALEAMGGGIAAASAELKARVTAFKQRKSKT
jgi:enoyl-CoA hydratase